MLEASLVILLQWRCVDLDSLGLNDSAYLRQQSAWTVGLKIHGCAYPLLELGEIDRAKGIRLCDNGDEIDSRTETLHDFNIQGLQSVSSWADEVKAGVYTKVDLLGPARLLLLKHVRFVLIVQEFDNGLP